MNPVIDGLKYRYFQQLTFHDLKARSSNSIADYIRSYELGVSEPQKQTEELIKKIDSKLNILLNEYGLKCIANIKYNIFISNHIIEAGLPHTLGNSIIIPESLLLKGDEQTLLRIMLHERIHIFQRMFPIISNKLYISYWNLAVLKVTRISHLQRSNPDNNNIVYGIKQNDKSKVPIFSSYCNLGNNEFELRHVQGQLDHPNEMMAYLMTSIIMKEPIINALQSYEEKCVQWMIDMLGFKLQTPAKLH